jgi:hypothetical protein
VYRHDCEYGRKSLFDVKELEKHNVNFMETWVEP